MVSYKPLFRYCLEHNISRADCRRRCGISPNTWTKINRNEEVSMAILNKICAGLGLSYGDIIEYVPQPEENESEVHTKQMIMPDGATRRRKDHKADLLLSY